jgi:CarD family transcriptional regulator
MNIIKLQEAGMMFKVGDRIVHPMHGAGVVEGLEKRGEQKQIYFVLRLFSGNLKVLVPADKTDQIGVRRVIPENEIASVIKVLKRDDKEKSIPNWNHRYRANLEKIRTGNVFAVAEVVRTLMRQDQRKGLSSGEKRMLESAFQILSSELVLAGNMDVIEAEALIKDAIAEG